MSLTDLPAVNAGLNTLCTAFLVAGFLAIRRGNETVHRRFMIAAFVTSTLFLVSYLIYHAYAGRTVFADPAWFRPFYLVILLTHTVLATLIVPLVLVTIFLGLTNRRDRHRRLARWTWPLWIYVSVTGVLIYLLLYWIFPQS